MRVSIVVTSYNYHQYIERCLRSLINQKDFDTKSYEIIVVDDASSDKTVEIVKKYKRLYEDRRLRLLRVKDNVGVAEAANIGIREAIGQFVARVDADDFVNSRFLLFLVAYLEANNGLLGVACDYVKLDNNEIIKGRGDAVLEPISCGIMYRRDMLIEAGLYNPDFRHCEEKELRARLGHRYRVDSLKIPLYRYRMHETNKTKTLDEYTHYDKLIYETYGPNGLASELGQEKSSSNPPVYHKFETEQI